MSAWRKWFNLKAALALGGALLFVGSTLQDTGLGLSEIAGVKVAIADDGEGGDGDSDDGGGSSASSRGASSSHSGGPGIFRYLLGRAAPRAQRPRHAQAPVSPPPVHADNEIVGLGITNPQLGLLSASGFQVLERAATVTFGTDVIKLRIPPGLTLEEARQQAAAAAPQAVIDFNHYYRPEQHPDRPCRGKNCLARELISWPANPDGSSSCGGDVRIGLIDTAINPEHRALEGAEIEIIRLADEAMPQSGKRHGTAVASLLVGSPTSRAPGLVPGGTLVAVDAFYRAKHKDDRSDAYSLARAMDILVQRDVHVINMSLAGPPNMLLEETVNKVAAREITLVAAAGNKGPLAEPVYPAAYEEVIAVTATDKQKRPYRRAGRGEHIDLAAPGVEVWTAASIKGARLSSGTSFAAPFVTSAIALMKAANPELTSDGVRDALTGSAEDLGEPGKDPVFGWGMLNARAICEEGLLRGQAKSLAQ